MTHWGRDEVHEADIQVERGAASAADCGGRKAKLLQELNENLHALSQPMTVLLCTLDYCCSLESGDGMKEMLNVSRDACEELRSTVVSMQALVRGAMKEIAGKERVFR